MGMECDASFCFDVLFVVIRLKGFLINFKKVYLALPTCLVFDLLI